MQQDANAAGEFAPYASGRTNVSLSTAEWPYSAGRKSTAWTWWWWYTQVPSRMS